MALLQSGCGETECCLLQGVDLSYSGCQLTKASLMAAVQLRARLLQNHYSSGPDCLVTAQLIPTSCMAVTCPLTSKKFL
jgi:hypothetical protein